MKVTASGQPLQGLHMTRDNTRPTVHTLASHGTHNFLCREATSISNRASDNSDMCMFEKKIGTAACHASFWPSAIVDLLKRYEVEWRIVAVGESCR